MVPFPVYSHPSVNVSNVVIQDWRGFRSSDVGCCCIFRARPLALHESKNLDTINTSWHRIALVLVVGTKRWG